MKARVKDIWRLSCAGLLTVFTLQSYAAGYKLEFQTASTFADAGDAAVVEDAGTNWYNSAGLPLLPQQLVLSGIALYVPTIVSGTANAPSVIEPGVPLNFTANGKVSSHNFALLPALHYSFPFKDRWAVGISYVPAWGFTEDYGEGSIFRYNLTRVYSKTIDIAPSLSYRIDNNWSVGIGPDFHYFSVLSRSHVNTAGLTASDSISRFSADDWGYGMHGGILYSCNGTRIGLNYRSQIIMDLRGYSDFVLTGIDSFETNQFRLRVPLPATTSLSAYHDVNPVWAVMGTLTLDQWSILNNYHAQNVQQPGTILPDVISPQHMNNTIDASIGTRYRWNDKWLFRGSLKYVSNPTQNGFRDINFPDGSKFGIHLGARYQMNKQIALDAIYGHAFVKTVAVNSVNPVTGSTVLGSARTTIDFAGGQIVWSIC